MKDVRNEGQFHFVRSKEALNIVRLLKVCTEQKDIAKGYQLHAYIQEHKFLVNNCYIASSLVSMYARFGALPKAQEVFNDLPVRDAVTWTALVAGYTEHEQGEEALKCFDSMRCEGHSPDAISFICALKACGSIGAAAKGEKIHDEILSLGILQKSVMLGSILVDMYVKCEMLVKAHQVLRELPIRDVVTWNALMVGYTQQGQGEEALNCFNSMQHDGHTPNVVTFLCAIKACRDMGTVAKGEQIHEMIVSMGMLEKDTVLGNALIDMYARLGAFERAQQVLNKLRVHSVVTWNSLISGYVEGGQSEEALKCFEGMQYEGHNPDVVTFICALKACGSIGSATRGKEVHDMIASMGLLEKDIALGSTLVDMYARCGAFVKAREVLDELHIRDVVTWTSLIAGYAQQGQGKEALMYFDGVQLEGHSPNAVTYICALNACASIGAVDKGDKIYEKIVKLGMLKEDIVLGSALIDMYAKCGALTKAQEAHVKLPVHNVATWNALIAGYAHQGQGIQALKCFDSMQQEGHIPDIVTFISVLKGCGIIGAAIEGEEIHNRLISLGTLEKDMVLGSTLVEMYAKCGALAKAQWVLNKLPTQDVVMWNALLAGYAQQGQSEELLECFNIMQRKGHFPNAVTYMFVLKACGNIAAVTKGEEIHDKIVNSGMLQENLMLGNSLVDMYARCGALVKAREVFSELPIRNVVMWNALIGGYIQQGQSVEALKLFDCMENDGHSPDVVTLICALKACGCMGAAIKGRHIHDKIVSLNLMQIDIMLGNTLVDMYVKCAEFSKAVEIFKELPIQDVVSWNVLIGGYAQQGQVLQAVDSFHKMQSKGVKPDSTTFICILNACSHAGLLDQAEIYFLVVMIKYGITPDLEHYGCMIDIFGRAGKFNKALILIARMPFTDSLPVWLVLLGICHKWGEAKLGRLAFEWSLHLDKNTPAAYVCMANIYMAADLQDYAEVISSK